MLQTQDFTNALQNFRQKYAKSTNFNLALNVIQSFERTHNAHLAYTTEYIAQIFNDYLNEIEFSEFECCKNRIIISTMHKSKGKEFDSVFMLVRRDFIKDEYDKRLLYVAMTRAKSELFIYTCDNLFSTKNFTHFQKELIEKIPAKTSDKIFFIATLKDVVLSNDDTNIVRSNALAGDIVELKFIRNNEKIGIFKNHLLIEVFSTNFTQMLKDKQSKGYKLDKTATIEYVIKWYDEDKNLWLQQILCKISMTKILNKANG